MRTELWYPAWKLKTGMAGLCLESAIQWYYYIALRNCQAYCSLLDSHCYNWPQSPLILSLVFMLKDWLQKCVLQCKYILWMDLKNLTYKHTALNTGGKQSQNVRSMQWQWSWGKKMSTKVQMSPAGHFTPRTTNLQTMGEWFINQLNQEQEPQILRGTLPRVEFLTPWKVPLFHCTLVQ